MITPVEWIGIVGGSTVLASGITAWAARRPSMINAFTKSYTDLAQRLASVEAKVQTLEGTLSDERKEHSRTREILATALRYIREVTAWGAGPRIADLPPAPSELLKEIN